MKRTFQLITVLLFITLMFSCDSNTKRRQSGNNKIDSTKIVLSIKDYYLPDSSFNLVKFYTPDESRKRTKNSKYIYYAKIGTNYQISEVNFQENNWMGKPLRDSVISIIEFTANEVKMTKQISTTMIWKDAKVDYNPPLTILKMPPLGQTCSWTYDENFGPVKISNKCTSSWTEVLINNSKRKAIKFKKYITFLHDNSNNNQMVPLIQYFVYGIGLWKTESVINDGTIEVLFEFDTLTNSTISKK